MKKIFLFSFLLHLVTVSEAQNKGEATDKLLFDILKKSKKFDKILEKPAAYKVQIIYTQINRDKNNKPSFKTYRYRVNKDEYFYPASTVKFPACLLALEKLNALKAQGIRVDKPTTMLSDSAEAGQVKRLTDVSNTQNGGLPTIEHYIKKILLVSDNDAFNRLYEFMGQESFNQTLYDKGYKDLRIVHRLSIPLSKEQNRRSNPIRFIQNGETVYTQPVLTAQKILEPHSPIRLGKGYMTSGSNYYSGDSLVNQPFDFTYKNYFALENQQSILKAMLFPESVAPQQRFNLTQDDYAFLYKYMSMSPLESKNPVYPDADSTGAWDSYCKFLMFGDSKKSMPKNIRIFNKVGDAYGFLLDNAYIVDFDKKIEFMLSAVIYCNSDEVFNDDKYDYDTIGFPFMAHLGKVIYDYELKRQRTFKPNLSKFKIEY